MKFDPKDEVMLEVAKLRRLIADCCPEMLELPASEEEQLRSTVESLSEHRQRIVQEASGAVRTKALFHWAADL
jgi:predicted nucleotidyltransferase